MTTRLDRLFLLLDTGSTPLIRKSAADQLGEVQKLHPYELHNLLSKIHGYLCSSNWETRIAAGLAVEAIAKHVPQWEPRGAPKSEFPSPSSAHVAGRILFSHFDINKVLAYGTSLLGSEGAQYDVDMSAMALGDQESLIRQRQLLNKRLGLDIAGNLGIDTDNIFNDEDLMAAQSNGQSSSKNICSQPVAEIVKQQLLDVMGGMSARERNRAKRRAKHIMKQKSRESQSCDGSTENEPPTKRQRPTTPSSEDGVDDKLVIDSSDTTLNFEEMEEWPFESFCELLMNDLFHTSWETRHGAATGLREVIKLHGRGAGKTNDTPADQLPAVNHIWLSDLALRVLCVLALDRFGDFVSDEVVAPVRETCAQTLGVIVKYLDMQEVEGIVGVLLQLLGQGQWEVRHGGLLCLKYLLAVRQDMSNALLPKVLPAVFLGLQDPDDDVRAVAAAALVPVTDTLVMLMPEQTPHVIRCLWETLLDLDDLTASTNSIMTLLSTLLAHPKTAATATVAESLSQLTPRLFPFLRHNIVSVRRADLQTLSTLLTIATPDTKQPVVRSWLCPILQEVLRHVFQRSLLEERQELLDLVQKVWSQLLRCAPLDYLVAAVMPWLGVWLCLLMQPASIPFDPQYLIEAKHRVRDQQHSRVRSVQEAATVKEQKDFIGGAETVNSATVERDAVVINARQTAAKLLGELVYFITMPIPNFPADVEKPVESLAKLFVFHLNTKSAQQRFVVAQVVYHWCRHSSACECPADVKTKILECLGEAIYFDEIAISFTRMQSDCQDFIASLRQQGIAIDSIFQPGAILTLEQANHLTMGLFEQVKGSIKPRSLQTLEDRRKQLQVTVDQTSHEQNTLTIRVLSSLALAAVVLDALPEKLNPVIRPLMDSIKKEQNRSLQSEASKGLAWLLSKCVQRNPSPNSKVLKNLCAFLCCDPSSTPIVSQPGVQKHSEPQAHEMTCDVHTGILTLTNMQKAPERSRRWYKRSVSVKVDSEGTCENNSEVEKQLRIQRQGSESALFTICQHFGHTLPDNAPSLWETCTAAFQHRIDNSHTVESAQELVNSLQVLETIGPALHNDLIETIFSQLESIRSCVESKYTGVRHMAARCFAMLTQLRTTVLMMFIIDEILLMLGATDSEMKRQGAVETFANVIDVLGMELVPYVVLLVVPILGRMSDQNEAVRLMATYCFASLIRLMPLEAGIPRSPEMTAAMVARKEKERQFLEQLMDSSKLKSYEISVPILAELRKYQQDGVNWLAFLNKYQLHGILCDDMGLGKTLQSICILSSDHLRREQEYTKSSSPDSSPIPSIVVCPPTLVGHWVYEVKKFVDKQYLNPLMYAGPPGERQRLQKKVKKHNLIVASYDVVRNDIDFFSTINWNYCILDEGHIIRNGKTKLSKAVKMLVCNHRLILSGTPIQNNVLDLWSLFDFLMPGFLGTERQFQARYGKPILQSRDAKSTTKEQEAGALAMESLHRQVLPFVLRRLKEDVLQDLPPKIIQDYYCDLSPLQVELYEDFARSRVKKGIDETLQDDTDKKVNSQGTTHIFQALQYLRKVCNHPALVLNTNHPKYESVCQHLKQQNSSLKDLTHAPKLTALKQLLNDCGIGVPMSTPGGSTGHLGTDVPVVNQHRVLLFCQLKGMLDIVEKDLLKCQLPSVTYLRLDGSVPAGSRHDIVHRFNNDPSIDMLLLTTHVGGLGLNLTGADTVIFVEHDWNPMKDLQAMDRAHRIGQKKVVNVYRLITRGTLEEKIMGLQKFKLTIANTVITQDNSSLQTMGTDQLLDLFTLGDKKKGESAASAAMDSNLKRETMRTILENLGDLWDEKQYENEFNLDNFMKSLAK
ncbi:LOW QUALITY PROTEIN: TATA-binding protein-associated factor 172-like [Haliotis rubra]|uniref:LOW QUALITY PROTEIN: TATA-binding protein-associated factor 172-like n=2 Tax=Haliotis rubra TaxID=36100 RepID=UPI001EE508F4|nr:LOW QUALITY PROTEIN: TATA-binding protein-associated factor 172-like [Haliotis rubra]